MATLSAASKSVVNMSWVGWYMKEESRQDLNWH